MSCNGSHAKGHAAAFGIGAFVGAILALFYAPFSGKETRGVLARGTRKLGHKAEEAIDGTKDAVEETKTKIMGAVDAGMMAVRGQNGKAGAALHGAKETIHKTVHKKKEGISAAVKAGKRAMVKAGKRAMRE